MSLKNFLDKFEAKVSSVRDGRPDPIEEFLDQTGVAYAVAEYTDERMTLEEAIDHVRNTSELERLRQQLADADREAEHLHHQLEAAQRASDNSNVTRERDEARRELRQAQNRVTELERELEQARNQDRPSQDQQQRRSRFGR